MSPFVPALPVEPPTVRRLADRVGASVIDQALSTGTNLAITLVAAQVLGARAFGAFGVVYLVATAVGGSTRSALGSTVLIMQADATRDHGARPLGGAVLTGLVSAVPIVGVAFFLEDELRLPLLALALVLPGMLVQDTGRMLEFAELRPGRALLLDAVWAAGMVLGLIVAGVVGDLSPTVLVLVWGGSGTVSGVLSLWHHGRRLPRPSIAWYRHSWGYAWRYLIVFASTLGVLQVTTLIVGGIVGVTAVGAVRATQVLYGPIQNLATGLMVAFVPDTDLRRPLREQRGRLLFVSALLTGVAGVIMLVSLVIPDSLGELVLGDAWAEAEPLLLAAGLAAVLFGVTSGAVVGLRAARAAHSSLVISLQMCAFQFVIPIAGAIVGGVDGFMWALTATWVIGTVLWWRRYLVIERAGPAAFEGDALAML